MDRAAELEKRSPLQRQESIHESLPSSFYLESQTPPASPRRGSSRSMKTAIAQQRLKEKRKRWKDPNGFSRSFLEQAQADQLTQEQIEEFKEAFALFDKDGDGTITLHELDSVMRGLGQNPTREELTQMIAEVDSDGNGSIEFSEFLILIASRLKMEDMREEIRDAFGVFDKNNDGRLSTSELKDVLSSVGEKMSSDDINEMVAAADSRGTGMIDIDEFSTLMMSGT